MLKIEELTKTYKKNALPAVNKLSLTIKQGEIYGFLGRNGAGKSTTIKCISGILTPDSGKITLDGFDSDSDAVEFKKRIGYVPDLNNTYEKISGRSYVNHIAKLYGLRGGEINDRVRYLAERFHLAEALDRPIKTYSHGMKQKLTVIAALVHKPLLWMLDEPMTGLDPVSTNELFACMREFADDGGIIFFSSHILDIVEKISSKIGIIKNGVLVLEKNISELNDGNLKDVYLESFE